MQPEEDILELEEKNEIVVQVVGIFTDNTAILSIDKMSAFPSSTTLPSPQ